MDRDRIIGWIVLPILCWACIAIYVWLILAHPIASLRVAYGVGIPAIVAIMLREWKTTPASETALALLCCAACADLMGVI